MTTPNPVQALLAAPRRLAAWALVGYSGLHLALVFLRWIVPADFTTFGTRSAAAAAGFTALVELAMPVLAVLLIGAGPGRHDPTNTPQPQARLIATVALIEYAVILFFGVVTYLIGLGAEFAPRDGLALLSYLLLTLGRLGLAAVAGLITYQAWTKVGGSLAALTRPSTPMPPAGPTPPAA